MPLDMSQPLPIVGGAHGERPLHALAADELLALLLALSETSHLERSPAPTNATPLSLSEAYRACEAITRENSRSFFFSSHLLPPEKRSAVRSLYAFCRTSDDKVDMTPDDPAQSLASWVRMAQMPVPPSHHPVLLAWHDTCSRYSLPRHLANELLAGVAMDLTISRYATFADLWLYCYRVASVVGLLSMHIVGFAAGASPYAIKLGVALQLTNILRDVGEDALRGRIYLPQEDLERFGLCDDDIMAGKRDERFKSLMRFEIARARQLYAESWPGIALLAGDSRLAIVASGQIYKAILDKIVVNDYDVFTKRAHLSLREKMALLPKAWQQVRNLGRVR